MQAPPLGFLLDAAGMLCALLGGLLAILGGVFWVWMLVDCLTNEASQGNDKIIWGVVILFGNFLGALLYFFFRRPRRKAELGR